MKLIFTTLILLTLSGCGNQVFIKKDKQTDQAFRSDSLYCKGEATGAWQNQNGTSAVQIKSQTMVPMTYEDCMRQMGYQQQ
ncbi:hypothetical protein [Thiosulfativibrio zosterae]|uniref:Lipoprotein n=1 Tax=Thiosulfativibrio zosterae TaxID=2675053 RepID=A0A6F8PJN9_9GAMM|nr:hypothetical protein [Thiosulfativibrio zosterae]BBP42296.1 hypothetical protein THMIRHAT_00420 [Thiosulfativibrio zosterae]